jgi:hypothetical protein
MNRGELGESDTRGMIGSAIRRAALGRPVIGLELRLLAPVRGSFPCGSWSRYDAHDLLPLADSDSDRNTVLLGWS